MTNYKRHQWGLWLMGCAILAALSLGIYGCNGKDSESEFGTFRCDEYYGKMVECDIMSEGKISCEDAEFGDAEKACSYNCVMNAQCADLKAAVCDDASSAVGSCLENCQGPPFVCGDGEEIPGDWKCDNYEDCDDGSDEANCESYEFTCSDGETIPESWVCDYFEDCSDGADEANCDLEGFTCGDGQVIPDSWHCDLESDCSDGSDELNCDAFLFVCDNGEEIPASWECDMEIDCADASDEHSGCARVLCE